MLTHRHRRGHYPLQSLHLVGIKILRGIATQQNLHLLPMNLPELFPRSPGGVKVLRVCSGSRNEPLESNGAQRITKYVFTGLCCRLCFSFLLSFSCHKLVASKSNKRSPKNANIVKCLNPVDFQMCAQARVQLLNANSVCLKTMAAFMMRSNFSSARGISDGETNSFLPLHSFVLFFCFLFPRTCTTLDLSAGSYFLLLSVDFPPQIIFSDRSRVLRFPCSIQRWRSWNKFQQLDETPLKRRCQSEQCTLGAKLHLTWFSG